MTKSNLFLLKKF